MNLVAFAHANGLEATKLLPRAEQKQLGQFMTPPQIAKVMAERACAEIGDPIVRILDPSAGAGILAAAAVEAFIKRSERPREISVVFFEVDARLVSPLKRLASRMRREGRKTGVNVKVSIRIGDFLLSDVHSEPLKFDLVLANPPYFKLNKSDPRSAKHAYAVYGQPNIYGLFMAACARLLAPEGRWCFITPRSWTNGMYFSAVRDELSARLRVDSMHIFDSRQEHFADDEILQEAMITWASAAGGSNDTVTVSTSTGADDLARSTLKTVALKEIVGSRKVTGPLFQDSPAGEGLGVFGASLQAFGIRVSTGPVVAFRASSHIGSAFGPGAAPLLWMQHVKPMRIAWPISKKSEYIDANDSTAWMLVPNGNMVLMRRFSPKEVERRVTAAPYIAGALPGEVLGLENHINYLYRPGGTMSIDETVGLAAYLNSEQVDSYLRMAAGNTQVNATDLRSLPMPPLDQIVEIGRLLRLPCNMEDADRAVHTVLGERSERVA